MNNEMTAEEIAGIEKRLGELLGREEPDVADFACRHLIRCLGEVKRLQRVLSARATSRTSGIFVLDSNSMLRAQGM